MKDKFKDWILYKDDVMMAVNKPAGIAVQPDKTGDESLVDILTEGLNIKLHLIHRIDRPVSGMVLFAYTRKTAAHLSKQFANHSIEKKYLVAVESKPEKEEATLVHYLQHDKKRKKAFISDKGLNENKVSLSYKFLISSDRYHFLEVQMQGGKFHQIRAQLAHVGLIIKGDVKYGARRKNKDRSIHLHASKLEFVHPKTEKQKSLEARMPEDPVWNVLKEN